jgi:hypothetical protein
MAEHGETKTGIVRLIQAGLYGLDNEVLAAALKDILTMLANSKGDKTFLISLYTEVYKSADPRFPWVKYLPHPSSLNA